MHFYFAFYNWQNFLTHLEQWSGDSVENASKHGELQLAQMTAELQLKVRLHEERIERINEVSGVENQSI